MPHIKTIIYSSLIFLNCFTTTAQDKNFKNFFETNLEYQGKIQMSLGGASPIGIPAEIRKIESFSPSNIIGFEINATKWIHEQRKYGIRVGLRLEGKGMQTKAKVKNYFTQIEDDSGAQTTGYFSGQVVTNANNMYLTLPILFVWNASEKWNLYGGIYFSGAVKKSFKGHIFNGIFREGTPVGEPVTFEDSAIGIYNFSEEINSFQLGEQIGIEYKLSSNFSISLDVTIANNQVFKKNFDAINFKMYNIYGNLGFSYILKKY